MIELKYTHKRTARHAHCVCWDGKNTDEVLGLLNNGSIDAKLHNPLYIIVRYGHKIETITHGWWVVKRENADIVCYDPETMKIKYTKLAEPIPMSQLNKAQL